MPKALPTISASRRDHLQFLAAGLLSLHSAASPRVGQPATTPLPPSGNLFVPAEDWTSLSARRAADPDLNSFTVALLDRAHKDLALPLLERRLEGRRLLGVSREFIRRALQWAFAFRLTGETIYLERARNEMLSVSRFPDWNPAHFLDVAEMAAGLAIALDWLRADLPAEDCQRIQSALVDKALAQVRHGHKTFRATNNWSQVCIGGMVLAALAVRAQEPALAAEVLTQARKDVLVGLQAYAPDGVYPEGPGYWSYGTTYSVLLVAALRGAGLTDAGVLQAPGFARSAEFYAQSIGPSGKHFNFADGNEGQELPCPIVFLAREFGQHHWLEAKRDMVRRKQGLNERFAPLSILWWPAVGGSSTPPPTHFVGQGPQPVAIWRSAWNAPNALWFAIKGGGAGHNHGHMDAGSFVLDWQGVRWAKDLGMQDYNNLESLGIDLWNMRQDSPRWGVYRLSAVAHNTLTIDDRLHNATAMAPLRMRAPDLATVDLSEVLGIRQAIRTVRFAPDAVDLDDRLSGAPVGQRVRWAWCTEADIALDGTIATLTHQGRTLRLACSGTGLQLQVLDISQPRQAFDQPNSRSRQLVLTAPVQADGTWRLQVRISAGMPATPPAG